MWKSARFRIRAIVSSPICTITVQHSLFPQSFTHYSFGWPCGHLCPPNKLDTVLGLPRSAQVTTSWEGSVFSPVMLCQRICTKQANNRSHAILARARYYKSRLALSCLTTFTNGSHFVNHPTQSSASFEYDSRNHTSPSRGRYTPKGGYIVRTLSTPPLPVTHCS